MKRRPPRSTRTDTLFPYTTLFRSLPRSRSCSDCISKRWRLSVKNGGEAKDMMLDFEAACDAHIRWRVRFRSAINAQETLDARRISKDHNCEVGIWLQGAGNRDRKSAV